MTREHWLSTAKMTVNITTDEKGRIVRAAPVVHKFIGQHLDDLLTWMHHTQGDLKYKDITPGGVRKHRIIIAGSRGFADYALMERKMNHLTQHLAKEDITILCGMARGADILGSAWAEREGIDVWRFQADWNAHGKSAGYMRNQEMADNASHIVAFWDGKSPGTKHMIDIATQAGLRVVVVKYEANTTPNSGNNAERQGTLKRATPPAQVAETR